MQRLYCESDVTCVSRRQAIGRDRFSLIAMDETPARPRPQGRGGVYPEVLVRLAAGRRLDPAEPAWRAGAWLGGPGSRADWPSGLRALRDRADLRAGPGRERDFNLKGFSPYVSALPTGKPAIRAMAYMFQGEGDTALSLDAALVTWINWPGAIQACRPCREQLALRDDWTAGVRRCQVRCWPSREFQGRAAEVALAPLAALAAARDGWCGTGPPWLTIAGSIPG